MLLIMNLFDQYDANIRFYNEIILIEGPHNINWIN